MATFGGTFNDITAEVEIEGSEVALKLDDKRHGPRPIVGSLVNQDGKGRIWTIELGTTRGSFVADDPSAFNRAIAKAIVADGGGLPGLFRSMFEMSPTISDAIAKMNHAFDLLDRTAQMLGEDSPDFSTARESFDLMVRQHDEFMRHLAPRGWALSPTMEAPWRIHSIAVKFLEHGGDADSVDEWLADNVIAHQRVTSLVGEIAELPVKAVWQWSFLAGEASLAMKRGNWASAAFLWLAIAEGMWRDLRSWLGASNGKFYKRGGLAGQAVTEKLTRSRESLTMAHDHLSRSVNRTYVEPLDLAPTSRHALLHGRVAGAVRKVHAAKAFTVVDAILEQASTVITSVNIGELDSPPWIDVPTGAP